MISLTELANKLMREKKVALFCHVRPDGDAVGSALALMLALKSLGIDAEVFCDDVMPLRFSFLKQSSMVKREFNLDDSYSALIAIDCAEINRLGDFALSFVGFKNTYSIDHHVSNTRFANINYVVDNASNCENIFDLIKVMNVNIDNDIANLLATGLVTDTGNFKHNNVTPNTFSVASELLKCGANFNNIVYNMFTKQTAQRAKLFGIVMSKIRYFLNDRLAIITISQQDIVLAGAKPDETEGFIDFIMGIDSVEVGASLMEISKNKYKVSFRSKSCDVNAVASSFGGGGHVCASGCQIFGEYEEVVDKVRYAVDRELPII